MSTLKERLYEFLEYKNLKASEFEKMCKLGNGFCSKANDNVRSSSFMLIKTAFPELNIQWLKTGFGDMLLESPIENPFDFPNNENLEGNMTIMIKMMHEFIQLSEKNSEANLINAEANKMNAKNLERLISLLENKLLQ